MKKIFSVLFIPLILLISGCEKEDVSKTGFETSVNGSSNGTSILKVSDDSGQLFFKGTIILTDGQLILELIDPDGLNAYSNSFMAPIEIEVDEFYEAKKGTWTLKYSSYNGAGSLNVHLSN